MKNLLSAILIVSFVGCSTTSKKSKDLGEITDADFKQEKQVRYNKRSDFYLEIDSAETAATNDESLFRALDFDGEDKKETDLSEVVEQCHEKDFEDAFKVLKNTSRKYLKNPVFWNIVGACYLLKKERRLALLFFNKALDVNSRFAPAYNNLGVMYYREKDYPRASVAFNKAVTIDSFTKTPRVNLGNLYLRFSLYNDAISVLSPLASKKDQEVMNLLGVAYLQKQDIKKAVSFFKKVNDDNLEKPSFGINAALAHWLNGNKERAEDIFDDVEIEKSKRWKAYYKSVKKLTGFN